MRLFKENTFSQGQKIIAVIMAWFLAGSTATSVIAQNLDVPYVPTPQNVVEQMLDIANVQPGDYVIDLGSGDGRIVIAAAKRGAWGHGIDLNPQRIKEARTNAKKEGVSDRVLFLKQDLFATDFSNASVITMYLLNSVNRKLRPHLLEELEPGTRVVSHSFDMGDWKPDERHDVQSGSSGRTHAVYYWIIPAKAEGSWKWDLKGESFSADIRQDYQEIDMKLTAGSQSLDVTESILKGKRIGFVAQNGNKKYIFSGRLEGDTIMGTAQIHDGDNSQIETWEASKN